jgi:F-type H+-transporting ATPase subunit delta
MGELTTLARPYAVAAYQRAKETGTAERWTEALAFLSAVLEDARIAQAAANPKTQREDFAAAFLDLCGGRLDAETGNFVRLLIQNRRLDLAKHVAELFLEYKADDEGYAEVEVITAFPFSGQEEAKVASVAENLLKKKARLKVSVDRSLIGGVYIRAGDRVVDASVRGQIERLAKRLWN